MREYKFRGKYVECNKWVYGCYVKGVQEDEAYILKNHDGNWSWGDIWFVVYPETVGQFTGLKDKNGEEIYEGDVVRIDDLGIGIVDYEEGRFAMRRREERFCWPVYCRIDHSPFVPEVIGNIYDNPELLD